MTPTTDEDIHRLLVHYPALTIGEYTKMFNSAEPVKVQSELSKKVEERVKTLQSVINKGGGELTEKRRLWREQKARKSKIKDEPTKKHRTLRVIESVSVPRSIYNFNKYAS